MLGALVRLFESIALLLAIGGYIYEDHGTRRPATLATSLLQDCKDFDGLYPHKVKHTWLLETIS